MDVLSKEMKSEDLRKWEFLKQIQSNSFELEKIRNNAIREIGVAYGRGREINILNVIK
jgi:hypothetical protein